MVSDWGSKSKRQVSKALETPFGESQYQRIWVFAVIYLKSTKLFFFLFFVLSFFLFLRVGHAIRKAVREVQENQARNRNSVNAVNRSFLAASINPVGLPPGSPTSLFGQDIGTSLQTLLESQAAAQTGLLLSDQQGSIFHSLLGARGIDTFSSMTALGGAALLEPFPSSNHPDALAAGYSSVGAGPRGTSDIPTSHHDDMATSLQRMAARGGGQQQSNRSQQQQQLDAMLFPHNFLAAAPTAADQLMRNAARVQQERRASFMAQRATGGIGSLDAAIRPSSRLHLLGDAQLPMSGEASHDTLLWANMRDISSAAAAGGAGRLGKPPRISKAKEERRKRRAKRMIDGSEDEEDDSDS
jgi:hypothetical protein